MRILTFSFILILLFLETGCGKILDTLTPAHRNSKAKSPELVCIQFLNKKTDTEAVAPFIAAAAPIVLGFAVDQVVKGLEEEAKLYSATYTGRTSSFLWLADTSTDPVSLTLLEKRLRLDRYVGDGVQGIKCPTYEYGEDNKGSVPTENSKGVADILENFRTMSVQLRMDPGDKKNQTIKVTPELFHLRKTKAKVSWWNSKVDVNVQLTLTSVLKEKDGKGNSTNKIIDIAQIDFPMGKHNISKEHEITELDQLASGLISLPSINLEEVKKDLGGQIGKVVPLNVSLKIMESNDFGDVIGKGATLVKDNKAKIVEEFLRKMGLDKEKDKGDGN